MTLFVAEESFFGGSLVGLNRQLTVILALHHLINTLFHFIV